ncbi:MAG: STN and carboxypeptidase regulatory-like domain-containing protein [Flavitalea sp.]
MKKQKGFLRAIYILTILFIGANTQAQGILERNMSLEVTLQRLDQVLEIMSNKGDFYFSYNSNILKKDSLVSAAITNKPVKEILGSIIGNGFEFRESGNYIILRKTPIKIRMVTSSAVSEDKFYYISGYVVDDQTGERISDASIYEKDRLVISNSDAKGYFKIKLKSKYKTAAISVSKEYYEDTTVTIEPRFNQSVTITLVPLDINEHSVTIGPSYSAPETIQLEMPINGTKHWLYTYVKRDSVIVEKTAIGKWLVSSRAKLQSLNLRKFFVARPYQISVVPGLSTNGKLNSQVINNFSFNLFGGYSGGTDGFELGGVFNIDRKSVRAAQIGGLFNVVGEKVEGLQIAGLSNTVLGNVKGLQIGGLTNFTKGSTDGMQIAGIANISTKSVKGLQIGGILNYTRRLKGVQIGLINISDTSDGIAIGLINIVLKGYHKLSFSTNEVMNMNASFKTGNSSLYSIFLGGFNAGKGEKVWSFGYGLGTEIKMGRRVSINPEITSQHLYLGSWDYYNIQNKLAALFNFKISKMLSVYAGPSYSVYVSNQDVHITGYKENIIPSGYGAHKFSDKVTGWFGWTAGINIFYKKPVKRTCINSL